MVVKGTAMRKQLRFYFAMFFASDLKCKSTLTQILTLHTTKTYLQMQSLTKMDRVVVLLP